MALLGKNKNNRDFKFYKLYPGEDGKSYGLEVAIDKRVGESEEFIVHVNYIGSKKNKALKQYKKLQDSDSLIDSKN